MLFVWVCVLIVPIWLLSLFSVGRVNVGLFCSTPGIAVARSLPNKVAMEMLFTGQAISSQGDTVEPLFCSYVGWGEDFDEIIKESNNRRGSLGYS